MMKRRLAFLQLNRRWLGLRSLLVGQHRMNRLHVARESGDWQIGPEVASGNVIQTTIVARGIVKPYPAGQVSQRLRSRPVRIILMPCDYAAVMRRFGKQLIMPEAHRAAEQLRRRHSEGRIPQQIMKTRRNAPRAEGVKERRRRVCGFVRVEFVKQVML